MANNPNQKGLSQDELESLSQRILAMSSADQCRVNITSGWRGYTRVATNRITSAGGADATDITITSVFGKRVASVNTNSLDDDSLRDAVRRAESAARLAPETPEYMPELGQQSVTDSGGYYQSTGELEPLTRAEAAALAIEQARANDQIAASYMDVRAGSNTVATSNGLFASHASTGVAYTLTSRTVDGLQSGWAGDEANDWNNIESERIANDAVRKCRDQVCRVAYLFAEKRHDAPIHKPLRHSRCRNQRQKLFKRDKEHREVNHIPGDALREPINYITQAIRSWKLEGNRVLCLDVL